MITLPNLNLLAFQSPGEYAINNSTGAVFPGDPDYDSGKSNVQAGQQNFPANATPPINGTGSVKDAVKSAAIKAGLSAIGLPGIANNATGGTETSFLGFPIERIATLVLGLVCITCGLLLFRSVRETVITGAQTAAKAAAI